MSDFEVISVGAPNLWRDYFGGFRPETSRFGRRVVDRELSSKFIGVGVARTWRATPDSPEQLQYLCIRAGGDPVPHIPDDAERDEVTPRPW